MAPYTKPLEPSIAAQVAVLCSFPKFGFQVRDVRCGWEDAEFADRFTVHVPCGWDKLEWYVQFNSSRPWDPPDVIFHSSPDGLCFQPLLLPGGTGNDSSSWGLLKDWQHNDSYRLLRLLLHLRALFLQQQRQQAEAMEDGRVKFELSTLAQQEFEVYAPLMVGKSTPEELQLAVPVLGIDLRPLTHFSVGGCWGMLMGAGDCSGNLHLRLLAGGLWGHPHTPPPALHAHPSLSPSSPSLTVQVPPHSQFKFPLTHSSSSPSLSPASPQQIKFPISGTSGSANGKTSTPQLKLGGPPLLLSLLGFPETKLPAWTDTMCTVAYLPELAAFIHQRLDTAVSSMQSRAEFISALPAVFGQPLETDTQLFSHTTLFVSANSCMCLVRAPTLPACA
ncbi:unnamed protein product [Closterium sp. Naga37s-1]|nr:unnamed protein product [Closterium sp. Naga37s-1]